MSPGVASPLPRVVPPGGATICKTFIPGGVSYPHLLLTVNRIILTLFSDRCGDEQSLCTSRPDHLREAG